MIITGFMIKRNIFKSYDMEKVTLTYLNYLMFYSSLSEESFTCLSEGPFSSLKSFYGLDKIRVSINISLIDRTFHQAKQIT